MQRCVRKQEAELGGSRGDGGGKGAAGSTRQQDDRPFRREEQEAIDPAFDRSLGLLARIATGRMTDATTWLHTIPKPDIEIPVETGKPAPKKDTQ